MLEKALHKTRKIKQKENIIADILKTEIKEEAAEEQDTSNIILNSTAEFCRTLGNTHKLHCLVSLVILKLLQETFQHTESPEIAMKTRIC